MKNKNKIFKDLKEKTEKFKKELVKYPEKDIAEYTRLIQSVDSFLKYGVWEDYEEDSNK